MDTPIAENSFTGMAVGAAVTGLRPIVEGMNMGFLLLAFQQISNNMGMLRYTSGSNFTIPTVVEGQVALAVSSAEHSQRLGLISMLCPVSKSWPAAPPRARA